MTKTVLLILAYLVIVGIMGHQDMLDEQALHPRTAQPTE